MLYQTKIIIFYQKYSYFANQMQTNESRSLKNANIWNFGQYEFALVEVRGAKDDIETNGYGSKIHDD